jgi:hypothetical protein
MACTTTPLKPVKFSGQKNSLQTVRYRSLFYALPPTGRWRDLAEFPSKTQGEMSKD